MTRTIVNSVFGLLIGNLKNVVFITSRYENLMKVTILKGALKTNHLRADLAFRIVSAYFSTWIFYDTLYAIKYK